MQYFTQEQFDFLRRFILNNHLFHYELMSTGLINPLVWFASWCIFYSSMAFFLLFILQWGLNNGGSSVVVWLRCFVIGFLVEIVGVQILILLVLYTVGLKFVRPRILAIRQVLRDVILRVIQNDDNSDEDLFCVAQVSTFLHFKRRKNNYIKSSFNRIYPQVVVLRILFNYGAPLLLKSCEM